MERRDPPLRFREEDPEGSPVLQDATWGGHETNDVTRRENGGRSDRTRSKHVVDGIECHPMGRMEGAGERLGKDTHGDSWITPPWIETQEHGRYMCCLDSNGEPIFALASHGGPTVIPSMLIAHHQSLVRDSLPFYESTLRKKNGLSQQLCCS